MNDNNECMDESQIYISSIKAPEHCTDYASFVFCGSVHGIIYIKASVMYQVCIENIDLSAKDFEFKQIANCNFSRVDPKYAFQYGSASYLPHMESIMIVEDINDSKHKNGIDLECHIFNLYELKWKRVADVIFDRNAWSYTASYRPTTRSGYNLSRNHLNSGHVYGVLQTGTTARYDINKNQWDLLTSYDKVKVDHRWQYHVWMNDHNTFCRGMKSKYQYLDLRCNIQRWSKMEMCDDIYTFIENECFNPILFC